MTSPYAERLASLPVSERDVVIGGARTSYWSYGLESAPTTILAVHGFRGDHHGLEPVVAELLSAPGGEHYRVLMPDLPAFGASDALPGGSHTLEDYVSWLLIFQAEVAPGSILLGHSFGSIVVAAAVAAGAPTPRVILINPIGAPALAGPRGVLTRLAVFYYWAGAKLPSRLGEALLRNPLIVRIMSEAMVKTRDRDLRHFVHDQHRRYFSSFADRDSLRDAFAASVSHDVSEFAETVDQPVLLIAAQRDDITTIEQSRRLRSRFDDAELVEIPDVGHLIHYETPGPAAEAIRSFL